MSWRKYGGINKLDQRNNITVNSIVADRFTVREAFLTTFNITGDFNIFGNAIITQKIRIGDAVETNNLDVSGNTVINGKIYMTKFANPAYLKGGSAAYTLGLNTSDPVSTFDISSNQMSALNVKTSNNINRNILARNVNDRGIALYVNDNTESSTVQFYGSNLTTNLNSPDAQITYNSNGEMLVIDTGGDIKLTSTATITNRTLPTNSPHILNETLIIYDTANGTYRYDAYNDSLIKTGNALTLLAQDNIANTVLNIVAPNKQGLHLVGGTYPKDATRSMAVIDVSNSTPSQIIVTGNSKVKYHSTIGFNTYKPKLDQYVVDINGPVHINNGEVTKLTVAPFKMNSIAGKGSNGIGIGSPYTTGKNFSVYRTGDGGQSWTNYDLSGNINGTTNILQSVYAFDENKQIMVGSGSFIFFTKDGGSNWNRIIGSSLVGDFTSVYIASETQVVVGHNNGGYVFTMNFDTIGDYTVTSLTQFSLRESNTKTAISGDGISAWIVYKNYIQKITISNPVPHVYNVYDGITTYKSISVFDSTHAVAVGENNISYMVNGTDWIHVPIPGLSFNSVYVHDEISAIAVGDAGSIYITSDGYVTWTPISDDLLNPTGTYIDRTLNISSIYPPNDDTLVISCIKTSYEPNTTLGATQLYYLHIPYLFNRENTSVIDVSGNMKLSGDLQVNDAGKIRSNNTTFDLLTNTVETLNVGLASTTVTMGAETGNTIVRNNLRVYDDIIGSSKLQILADSSLNAKLFVADDVSFNKKMAVGGNVVIHGGLIVDGLVNFTGDIFRTDINLSVQTSQQIDISNHTTGTALTVRQYGPVGNESIAKFYHGDDLVVDFKHTGDVSLNQTLYVTKTTDLHGVATVSNVTDSSATSNGALIVFGGVGITKNMNIGGNIHIRNTTDSLSSTTGALIVDGGVGIANKLNVGDNTGILGTLTVEEQVRFNDINESNDTSTGALTVSGGVGISKNVNVGGVTKIHNSTVSTSTSA